MSQQESDQLPLVPSTPIFALNAVDVMADKVQKLAQLNEVQELSADHRHHHKSLNALQSKIEAKLKSKQKSVEHAKIRAQVAHDVVKEAETQAEEERVRRDELRKQAEQSSTEVLEAKMKIKYAAQVAAEAQEKSAKDMLQKLQEEEKEWNKKKNEFEKQQQEAKKALEQYSKAEKDEKDEMERIRIEKGIQLSANQREDEAAKLKIEQAKTLVSEADSKVEKTNKSLDKAVEKQVQVKQQYTNLTRKAVNSLNVTKATTALPAEESAGKPTFAPKDDVASLAEIPDHLMDAVIENLPVLNRIQKELKEKAIKKLEGKK